MRRDANRPRRSWIAGVLFLVLPAAGLAGGPAPIPPRGEVPAFEESRVFLVDRRAPEAGDLARFAMRAPLGEPPPSRYRLDVAPLIDEAVAFLRSQGIPLRNESDRPGVDGVLVSASFRVRDDLPAIGFHAGSENPDPRDAFYARESDASVAFILPFDEFQFRIEGGDDSNFGYYGIGGVQWQPRGKGLVAGIGVPVRLRNAKGDAGVVFQVRLTLP